MTGHLGIALFRRRMTFMKVPVRTSAVNSMMQENAAPMGHLSPATWKKPAMVSAKTVVLGPPSKTGVA